MDQALFRASKAPVIASAKRDFKVISQIFNLRKKYNA